MRVVLISTPTRQNVPNYIIPTGILSIAAYLRDVGHEVFFIDAALTRQSHADIAIKALELKPDVLGISGIITSYAYVVELSHALKKTMPFTPIVLGGHITINNIKNCFERMRIDYLVHGYGEIAVAKILRHVAGQLEISQIPGISYRDGNLAIHNHGREFVEDINQLPLPAYDLADMEHYATVIGKDKKLLEWLEKRGKTISNFRFITMMGALGCIARCTFCVHEQEFLGIRYYSDQYILKHLNYLYHNHNIRIFAIGEEMFVTDAKRVKNFNKLVKENFPEMYWRAATRAQFVTEEFVAALDDDESSCYSFVFGFESGSQRVLNLMNKRTQVIENVNAYRRIKDSRFLNVNCSLMIGNVGETQESIQETIDSIKVGGLRNCAVFFTSAYPGGRIWDWAVERGVIENTHEYLIHVSGKDAMGNININLTPYSNWVLWAWRALVESELANQAFLLEKDIRVKKYNLFKRFFPLWRAWPLNIRSKGLFKKLWSLFKDGTFIFWATPVVLIRSVLWVYFIYYKFTRKIFSTAKDKMYLYETDNRGVLLPKSLIRGVAQKYHDQLALEKIMQKKCEIIELSL